ncbi:proliferating cell nuclear antigen PcnA [Methanocaldococcus infernus ME]|uniref:DNA polymerase sliding clamp n=1 Tax=Methanocaldococcus infernus (strain DSM 11812 / JCM 15783 / ME) TaxID=573063 RepID=D5VS91_METIM|nr:DNA polymerase sliding clamp [Methanocaldococcus infernus]ADG13444.1 proliferating cell nuclear antigen PcnA [Methanocaldococcus infernus ME]
MFKAKLESAKEFKKVVDTMATLLDEICLQVNEEGVRAAAMDPSHVALLSLNIPRIAFEDYQADEHEIGIELEAFKKIMNRAKAKDKLILELDEERNRLNVIFENQGKRKFSLSLLDLSGATTKVPELEYHNVITIKGDALKEALKDADLISDHVIMRASPYEFKIEAKGDLNDFTAEFSSEDDAIISIEGEEEVKSAFNLEYLLDMVKGVSKGDIVKLYLGNDMPLKMEYSLAGCELMFLLAPRIEE